MKNIVSTDDSVKRQITDSISENLTDSDLESIHTEKRSVRFNNMKILNFAKINKIQLLWVIKHMEITRYHSIISCDITHDRIGLRNAIEID